MLEALAVIALVLLVAVAGVLIFAATKPSTFRVQRATSIKAPPETIFALINNFRNWRAWSPWEKMDPALKRTYSGPESGKGAVGRQQQRRQGTHGDHRRAGAVQGCDQARFPEALRGP